MTAAYEQGQEDAMTALDRARIAELFDVPLIFVVEDDDRPEIREYMTGVWSILPDAIFCDHDWLAPDE